MAEEEYIYDEDKLADLFENLKRGRCDECNRFADMLIPPYKVKQVKKAFFDKEGKIVRTRIYQTGFIRNCAEHTPYTPWDPNRKEEERPEGEEGIDWKIIDSVYYVRTKVFSHNQKDFVLKEYRNKGKTYRYPSHKITPVFKITWVVWKPTKNKDDDDENGAAPRIV